MADNEKDNNPTKPENEDKKDVQDQQKEEKEKAADKTPEEKKNDKAIDIARQIKNKREERAKLEQAIAEAKDEKDKEAIAEQIKELDKDTHGLAGQARAVLSPELEREIEDEEKHLDKLAEAGEKIDFAAEKTKAKQLEETGRTQGEPVSEVAGMILGLEVQELEQLSQIRASFEKSQKEERGAVATGAETWAQVQDKKEKIQIDSEDKVEASRARAELARLAAREEQLIKEALETDPQLQKDKEELDSLSQQARDPENTSEVLARVSKLQADAVEQEERKSALHRPDAGLRLHYVNKRADEIYQEGVANTPVFRRFAEAREKIDGEARGLLSKYDKGEISPEEIILGGQRLKAERKEAEQAFLQQLSGERGKYYEPMPQQLKKETTEQYHDRLETWVWEKIKAIDTASISPSALVYSPAYTSLLYALTEADLPSRLKDNINAWRGTYEVSLVWDGSGRPEDVLARAADLDPDAFLGLIGQYQRNPDGSIKKDAGGKPLYTEHAAKIQKAFAQLERHGYELTHGSTAESRRIIHETIANTLDQGTPEDRQFGVVYERIAYRYWKFLGREGRFDRVVIETDQDMKVTKDEKVFVYRKVRGIDGKEKTERITVLKNGDIKKGDLVSISQTGDEIASRRNVDRRYNTAFSKTSIKFWYRRLVGDKMVAGLRQEKNIKFLPTRFDHISYGIKDFLTDQMGLKMKKEDPSDDQCVERINEGDLGELDWENRTGTYAVWVDDLRKAADTRKELIKSNGILDRPVRPDVRTMAGIKEVYETFPDKSNTALRRLLDGIIEDSKGRRLPRLVLRDVLDDEGKPTGMKHWNLTWSKLQDETGVPYESMNRGQMEDFIDEWVAEGFVTAAAGEALKRKHLRWLGLPGIGPVRFTARIVESVTNPGNIFGVLFAMLGKFIEVSLPAEVGGGGGGGKRK